jgi:calcineurin-like phosphoesterase family protein
MLKIKKHRRDYNRILFCSDTHMYHNRDFLWEPRGFKSTEEHSDWIQSQIDSLTPDDLLIHGGDIGLSAGAQPIQNFMLSFPCETLMVLGNHNSGVYQLYQQHLPRGFEKCQLYPLRITPNITLMGYEFLLDIDQDQFYIRHMAALVWPFMNKNYTHICGHSHGNLIAANPGENGIGKVLDVGVENAIKYNGTMFFSLEEVRNIMNKKDFSKVDHHG